MYNRATNSTNQKDQNCHYLRLYIGPPCNMRLALLQAVFWSNNQRLNVCLSSVLPEFVQVWPPYFDHNYADIWPWLFMMTTDDHVVKFSNPQHNNPKQMKGRQMCFVTANFILSSSTNYTEIPSADFAWYKLWFPSSVAFTHTGADEAKLSGPADSPTHSLNPVLVQPRSEFMADMTQLTAILDLNLTELWCLESWKDANGERGLWPAWFDALTPQLDPNLLGVIKVTTLNCKLDLLHKVPPKGYELAVSALWDSYAMSEFKGRFLSGCCHLGCKNFGGCSESALATLLCAGCRKVRYCNVRY